MKILRLKKMCVPKIMRNDVKQANTTHIYNHLPVARGCPILHIMTFFNFANLPVDSYNVFTDRIIFIIINLIPDCAEVH